MVAAWAALEAMRAPALPCRCISMGVWGDWGVAWGVRLAGLGVRTSSVAVTAPAQGLLL